MIIGIGCDLVSVARIRSAIQLHAARFIRRVYTEKEIKAAEGKPDPVMRYAKYWAAKEAGFKALSLPRPARVSWQDFEVTYLDSGQPFLLIGERVQKNLHLTHGLGSYKIHLSISDEVAYAMAYAVLEAE